MRRVLKIDDGSGNRVRPRALRTADTQADMVFMQLGWTVFFFDELGW